MPAHMLSTSEEDLDLAASALREGQLVAFPTETVYGLGANALDANAVARVFEAKQRPHFDPLIVHIASDDELSAVVSHVPGVAQALIDAFWPGPLTLVLPKTEQVPALVTAGLSTVAVRFPAHPIAQQIITRAGVPVAAPSANPFGRLSPTRVAHVLDGLGATIDFVVDGGSTPWGVESTIVDVNDGTMVRVLRHGALEMEEIAAVVGVENVMDATAVAEDAGDVPQGPGQLSKHYAPHTRLVGVERGIGLSDATPNSAYLGFRSFPTDIPFAVTEVLSTSGDLREAAANLFDALHRLDSQDVDVIYAEWVTNEGIGRAINDRLRRAAATFD
jgi:L-threonylcarbamoyladenylate synthase